jgi:hypothetical protein
MISASQKFFATRFAYWGLLFSKLSLISIGEGGGGVPQNFLDSKNHLAVPSGTSELSTPSIPLQHKQTRKYDDNYLVNSTALLRPSRPGFLSIKQRASVFYDRLLFSTHFHLAVGVRGFRGSGESRSSCISDNDGSACTGSEIPYGCIAQFRFPLYASITQKCFTFVLADTCSSHVITHHLGVLHAESPQGSAFLLLVITYSSR